MTSFFFDSGSRPIPASRSIDKKCLMYIGSSQKSDRLALRQELMALRICVCRERQKKRVTVKDEGEMRPLRRLN